MNIMGSRHVIAPGQQQRRSERSFMAVCLPLRQRIFHILFRPIHYIHLCTSSSVAGRER